MKHDCEKYYSQIANYRKVTTAADTSINTDTWQNAETITWQNAETIYVYKCGYCGRVIHTAEKLY